MGSTIELGSGEERQELVAEVAEIESVDDARRTRGALATLDVAAAWEGEPGRRSLPASRSCATATAAEVAWIPATCSVDDAVRARIAGHVRLRGHNVKELMRSFLGLGVRTGGLTLDTAIAAYLIDPAEARYELPDLIEKYTRFARPSDDAAAQGQLDLDGRR